MDDRTHYKPVDRTHTCKRCGSTTVTWQSKGEKPNLKWWLSEVFMVDGVEQSNRLDFHTKFCGKPELHTAEQAELDAPPEADQIDEREIEILALLAAYPPFKRRAQIQEMRTNLARATNRYGADHESVVKLTAIIELAADFISELED